MKVLLIAYACEPNKGSEPGVGWNWVISLSKYVNLTVITRENNRNYIEQELLNNNLQDKIKFIYYDLFFLTKFKKLSQMTLKLYYFFWVKYLKNFIKKNNLATNFDLVHFITLNTFLIPPPINKLGIKSIWGPIGGGIIGHHESFKKLSYISYLLETIRSIIIKIGSEIIKKRKILDSYNRVIFANFDTAKMLGKNNGTIELETGINSSNISRSNKIKNNKYITILFSGVLEPRKGLHLLLDALKIVQVNYRLIVLGKGFFEKKFKKMVIDYKLKNVEFLGFVHYTKALSIYNVADIFVFPSLRDTSGNVVLEAMSQGLPTIAFDHHGMHDILNEECAIKIPVTYYQKMVSELANAIDKLANDYELRKRMGSAAINRIKEYYLWEDKAKRMVEIYKEVLNENTSST